MNYMFEKELMPAYEKSDEICKKLQYESDRMISTQDILDVVKKGYCKDIDVHFIPFDELDVNNRYGAMMRTELDSDKKPTKATILINSSKGPKFQRFSLVHELGHLVTGTWTCTNKEDSQVFTLSTHIDFDITNIDESDYADSEYLLNEQIANIFALRVLMPGKQYYELLRTCGDISEIAKFFGLTEDAVISRAKIGA